MAIMKSSILTRDLQPPGIYMFNSTISSELGGKPSIVNPTDAVTTDNTVPFSVRTHVNKTDSSDMSTRAGVGIN